MQSGKWYWEIEITASSTVNTNAIIGISSSSSASALPNYPGFNALGWGYYGGDGDKYHNSSAASYGAAYGVGDVIGVSFDVDTGDLEFYKNNVSQGVAYTGLTDGPYFPAIGDGSATTTFTAVANFGQSAFAYTPPTGFVALSSANLPAPVIADGKEHFEPVLYTGNGATQSIGGLEFQPDFVWIKNRDGANSHQLTDAVRGSTKYLFSDGTLAEETRTNQVTSFDSAGITVGSNAAVNGSGDRYVAWNWNAGGSTVANTDGTITSQVRASTTAGFSIMSYTGSGSAGGIGHGLNSAPDLVIAKNRQDSGTSGSTNSNWAVYHSALGYTKNLQLNESAAPISDSNYWGNADPDTSVVYVSNYNVNNASGKSYIMYAFHSVDGFSKFGRYTGNGSADGPFVYTGFRPAFVMVRRTDAANSWVMMDDKRSSYNYADKILWADLTDAEATGGATTSIDFLSNGFKARGNGSSINASGGTYIYMAFAENPFKTARAR
jgi:hypothetical protein